MLLDHPAHKYTPKQYQSHYSLRSNIRSAPCEISRYCKHYAYYTDIAHYTQVFSSPQRLELTCAWRLCAASAASFARV